MKNIIFENFLLRDLWKIWLRSENIDYLDFPGEDSEEEEIDCYTPVLYFNSKLSSNVRSYAIIWVFLNAKLG